MSATASVLVGGECYFEECSVLPKELALSIMRDETCAVLPMIKKNIHNDSSNNNKEGQEGGLEFIIVLRNLVTNQEYMHPHKVTSLDNWHSYFLDCPLMEGLDFVAKTFRFPEISSGTPSSYDDTTPVIARNFMVQGRKFRVTVTRAPPSPNSAVVFYAVTNRDLPARHDVFERILSTSSQRKECLKQYAMLALMEGKGMVISPAKNTTTASIDENLIRHLSLEHGPRIIQGDGTKQYEISGWFEMHEAERTAASGSLPLLLKHLFFLQFSSLSSSGIRFYIKAPNKYSYMVWIPDLGGFEIYYQVNMNASLNAMRNAFSASSTSTSSTSSSRTLGKTSSKNLWRSGSSSSTLSSSPYYWHVPRITVLEPPQEAVRSDHYYQNNSINSSLFLDMIQKQIHQRHQTLMSSTTTTTSTQDIEEFFHTLSEEDYVTQLQLTGLETLEMEVGSIALDHLRLADAQSAKQVLEHLLAELHAGTLDSSSSNNNNNTTMYIKTAAMVLMGIVNDVWENLSEKDETKKAKALIHLLSDEIGDKWTVRLKDMKYLPVVIKGCLHQGDQPYKWWERFMSVCDIIIVNPHAGKDITATTMEGNEASYLCASLIHSPSEYTDLFPSFFHHDDHDKTKKSSSSSSDDGFQKMVKKASSSDRFLGNMKDAYDVLIAYSSSTTTNSIIENRIKANDEARKLYYVRAVAYMILLMNDNDISMKDKLKKMRCY